MAHSYTDALALLQEWLHVDNPLDYEAVKQKTMQFTVDMLADPLCRSELFDEIKSVLNKHSRENASNTPDFILADYLQACLEAFEFATVQRESWYGIKTGPKLGDPT